jgi:micrococcal nuclease
LHQQLSDLTTINATPSGSIVTVTRVVDGDTIEISTGEKVRYIGMNTPETVDPRRPVQCYGHEASAKNKELVEGQTVLLEKDVSDKDKYGRLLRYVWLGSTMINEVLVQEGYAEVDTVPPDVKYKSRFIAAERHAIAANMGLWGSACNVPTPKHL